VEIRYVRFALPDWRRIETAARDNLTKFMMERPR